MDPKVCGKLLTHHRKGSKVDVEPLRDRFPLRQITGEGPQMEACGGGKSISWTPLRVSDFSGIYSGGIRSNGALWAPRGTRARLPPQARPGASWAPAGASGLLPKLLVLVVSRKKSPKSFMAFGLHLVLIFYKTKDRHKTTTGTGH
jgi:hypothetical protein